MANSNSIKLFCVMAPLLLAACDATTPPTAPVTSPPGTKTVVVIFGADAETTLKGNLIDDGLVPILEAKGYELFALDLPCHRPGENGLTCWRTSLEAGDLDLFGRYCRELSRQLTAKGVTNVIAVGQSRGGYVATTCAASDLRFTKLVLLKPVTDLSRLLEFNGYNVDQSLFGLGQYRYALLSRSLHILIGSDDTRVGTDAAIKFAEIAGAEIELAPSFDHALPGDGWTAQWVLGRL